MSLNRYFQIISICLALFSAVAYADKIEYAVSGVEEPMLENVRNHVAAFRIGGSARVNSRLKRKLTEDAVEAAQAAMRPYGYFNPVIEVAIALHEEGTWIINVKVDAGPPVIVENLHLELTGPGRDLETLKSWYANFPIAEGHISYKDSAHNIAPLRSTINTEDSCVSPLFFYGELLC